MERRAFFALLAATVLARTTASKSPRIDGIHNYLDGEVISRFMDTTYVRGERLGVTDMQTGKSWTIEG